MIEKVIIQNFQSHKLTTLDFHESVNVIIGSSDCGKSAIIKAIRWVIENKPVGDKFRNWYADDEPVSVQIWLDSGDCIERKLHKGINQYLLNGKVLKAFNRDVPDEIKKVVNMTEINLQLQLDRHFLLMDTSGNVARHFNKVANLDKIDQATANIKKAITQLNTSVDVQKEKLEQYETELKTYPNVEQLDLDLEELETLEKQRVQNSKSIVQVKAIIDEHRNIRERLAEADLILQHEPEVDRILTLLYERENKNILIKSLQASIELIETNEKRIAENDEFLKSETVVNNLLALMADRTQKQGQTKALKALVAHYKVNKEKVLKLQEKALELEEVFHAEMPDVCFFCNQVIKK